MDDDDDDKMESYQDERLAFIGTRGTMTKAIVMVETL